MEAPSGMREMQTFRKLPMTMPKRKKKSGITVSSLPQTEKRLNAGWAGRVAWLTPDSLLRVNCLMTPWNLIVQCTSFRSHEGVLSWKLLYGCNTSHCEEVPVHQLLEKLRRWLAGD